MSIKVQCEACGQAYRVAVKHAGRRIKCKQCGAAIGVPGSPVSSGGSAQESWYVRFPDGRVEGPISRARLDRWHAEGRLLPDCGIGKDPSGSWRPIGDLFSDLAEAPQRPAVPAGTNPPPPSSGESPAVPSRTTNPFDVAVPVPLRGGGLRFDMPEDLPPDPEIKARLLLPAIGLMVTGVVLLLLLILGVARSVLDIPLPGDLYGVGRFFWSAIWPSSICALFPLAIVTGLYVISGYRLRTLRGYHLGIASAVLIMFPWISPCCCLGVPVGVWTLVVLLDREVKAAFRD